ncbi:MAG: 4Fe-4S dicluster domain-containing protein [Thermodesulfobacteriota bacterium]|nr:4Fe-4S dicluster domain-containing protein [Thermodesulfobacteriota bacterium]
MKEESDINLTRRLLVKTLMAGAAATMLPLSQAYGAASAIDWAAFFQKRFQELTPQEIGRLIIRLEAKYKKTYGRDIKVKTTPPIDNVEFAYALNLSKCIGCRRCVYSCAQENNLSRKPHQIHYIRVLRFQSGPIDFEKAQHYYDPREVPETGYFYVPVQCQHCRKAPCVKVCPIKATWTEKDGTVVVDYDWCIGCRYCMAACPYKGRNFNWAEPQIPPEEINPNTHYLGNRPRMKNVVEKCTFCVHRSREGRYPACVEACPVGARKFGNLLDINSEVRQIIETKRVFRLKEDLNTDPRFFYFFHS